VKLAAEVFEGRYLRLEPLVESHREPLRAAVDRDPPAFDLLPAPWAGEAFDGFWRQRMEAVAARDYVSYAVRRLADDQVVGSSSFLNLRLADRGVEIGATYLQPDARGGLTNAEAKLLMLGQAFDAGAMRVELVTDQLNLRSQAAIAKLGARREGVLRSHRLTWTGRVRDTVVFSILDTEWPAVREGLERRLA